MKRGKLLISGINAVQGQKTRIEIKKDEFEEPLFTHRNFAFGALYVLLLCWFYQLVSILIKG